MLACSLIRLYAYVVKPAFYDILFVIPSIWILTTPRKTGILFSEQTG